MRAEVICDSVGPCGVRLLTMMLEYPRIVHPEFTRHRWFSFAVGSTRAIPSAKLRQRLLDDPAQIVWWGKNAPGMVAKAELDGRELLAAQARWRQGLQEALRTSEDMERIGLHKQIANRCLETYSNVYQLTTATWEGWQWMFAQRVHPDAQPEFRAIATLAKVKAAISKPQVLRAGEWHLPYVTDDDRSWVAAAGTAFGCDPDLLLAQMSAARCARTSYLNQDGKRDVEKDLETFKKLVTAEPKHMSPLEHQARAMAPTTWLDRAVLRACGALMGRGGGEWGSYRRKRLQCHGERFLLGSGNLNGWHQFRKQYEENP